MMQPMADAGIVHGTNSVASKASAALAAVSSTKAPIVVLPLGGAALTTVTTQVFTLLLQRQEE